MANYPIDVSRLIGDNQRMQRDISSAQNHIKQIISQLEKAVTANKILQDEKQQLSCRKEQQINQFISTHKQLYQDQLSILQEQKQKLIAYISEVDIKKQGEQILNEKISKLHGQIQKLQQEKKKLVKDYDKLNMILLDQTIKNDQTIQTLKIQIQTAKKKIIEIETINKQLAFDQQTTKNKITLLEMELLKSNVQDQSSLIWKELLRQEYPQEITKIPIQLLKQIKRLRKSNTYLLNETENKKIECLSQQSQAYSLLKKLHQQIALLRYQLSQVHDHHEDNVSTLYNQNAQIQLENIKIQKQRDLFLKDNNSYKIQVGQLESQLQIYKKSDKSYQKLFRQLSLSKIKLFVLESMNVGEKYRKMKAVNLSEFETQLKSIICFCVNEQTTQILQGFIELHQTIRDMSERLVQQESVRLEHIKKYRYYKQRFQTISKKQCQFKKIVQQYRRKQKQYQTLIEKIHEELEKAYFANIQVTEKRNLHLLITPYQRQIQLINSEVIFLQGQIKQYELNLRQEKQNYQQQIKRLNQQIKRLSQVNTELSKKNRYSESQLLQQTLQLANSKIRKNYQVELAEKTSLILKYEYQIRNLQQKFQASEIQKNNEKQINLSYQREINRLQNTAGKKEIQYAPNSGEIRQLQQKLFYLEGVFDQFKSNDKANDMLRLYNQFSQVKMQLHQSSQEAKHQEIRAINSEKETQGYRIRLTELEDNMKKKSYDIQRKNIQIIKLSQQNKILNNQISKLEKEFEIHRGSAKIMNQIDLIESNKDLQAIYEKVQADYSTSLDALAQKQEEIESLKKQIEGYWSDNLRLVLTLKENNLQLKQTQDICQKYDMQQNERERDLSNQIQNLIRQNNTLTNLVEDLRLKVLERSATITTITENPDSNRSEEELKNIIAKKQRQISFLQQEIEGQNNARHEQKVLFQSQWNKLVAELQSFHSIRIPALQQQISSLQHQVNTLHKHINFQEERCMSLKNQHKLLQESKVQLLQSQDYQKELAQSDNIISKLKNELFLKDSQIRDLQQKWSIFKNQGLDSEIFSKDVIQMRQQIQVLMKDKFVLQDRVRVMEQQNNLLKVHRISETANDPHSLEVFSHQTFGPSQHFIIQTERNTKNSGEALILEMQNRLVNTLNYEQLYKQLLSVLFITSIEIENLRNRIEQVQKKADMDFERYVNRLKEIQYQRQWKSADFDVLAGVQCSHQHLMEWTNLAERSKKMNLTQIGTLTDSLSGGRMIESCSVRGYGQSLNSQNMISF